MKSPKHHMKASVASSDVSNDASTNGKVMSESPLLNLFLNTLQTTPQTFFSSDKEGEESSSNTEVER